LITYSEKIDSVVLPKLGALLVNQTNNSISVIDFTICDDVDV